MSVPGRSLQDTMTSRIAPLYGFCTALLTFLVCTSIASAQNPQGGFFEKDFATKGYENVFQLRGGILKYLEEFPHRQFEGECFVFDDRVAVQQNLQPTRTYVFCPLCGTPASSNVTCFACGAESKICRECQEAKRFFCSLRCQNCGDQHKAPREEI